MLGVAFFCRAAASLVLCRLAGNDQRAAKDEDWATLRREICASVLQQWVGPLLGWVGDAPAEDEANDNFVNIASNAARMHRPAHSLRRCRRCSSGPSYVAPAAYLPALPARRGAGGAHAHGDVPGAMSAGRGRPCGPGEGPAVMYMPPTLGVVVLDHWEGEVA